MSGPAVESREDGVAWVISEWEARLSGASGLELQIVDRIDKEAVPNLRQHRGVYVDLPTGVNSGELRDRVSALMIETVRLVLLYRINPQDQKASRAEALDLGERIRYLVTHRGWHRDWNVTISAERRDRHPASAEWFVIEHTYTMRRYARVGG